jgi:hypothetical protein
MDREDLKGSTTTDNVRMVKGGVHDALEYLAKLVDGPPIHKIFVIGGGSVYKEALASGSCRSIYLTQVLFFTLLSYRFECIFCKRRYTRKIQTQVLKDFPFDVSFPPVCPSTFEITSVGDIIQGNTFGFARNTRVHASCRARRVLPVFSLFSPWSTPCFAHTVDIKSRIDHHKRY